MATYNAGIVTAYGAAKQGGYTGTYEEFCEQQANYANTVVAVEATAAHCEEVADHCDEVAEHCDDVLESIPQDYTNLNNEVTDLKSALSNEPFRYINLNTFITNNRGESIVSHSARSIKATFPNTWGNIKYIIPVANNADYRIHASIGGDSGRACYYRITNLDDTVNLKTGTADTGTVLDVKFNTGANNYIAVNFGVGSWSGYSLIVSNAFILEVDNLFIDDTLSRVGMAAEAKKTGDEITRIDEVIKNVPQNELAQFYKDGYLLYIPQYQVPYKTGERYIDKQIWVPITAGKQIVYKAGSIVNGANVRIEFYTANKEYISGISFDAGTASATTSPITAAYMLVRLNALLSTYADADGLAVFSDIWFTDEFGKEYAIEDNVSINSGGLKVSYEGRKLSYFFKDKIDIIRTESNQYTYALIYDDLDFSSYTGQSIEIPNNSLKTVEAKGKFIVVQVNQSSSSSVLIDYDEQIDKDATELNTLINAAANKTCRFLWFSDSHADFRHPLVTDSLERAKADAKFVADHVKMDFVLHSGDLVAQSMYSQIGNYNAIRYMSKELIEFGKIGKLIYAVGNHDGISANSDNEETTLYDIGYDYKNKGKQYYYFDNDGLNLRFVIMANPDNDYYGVSKEQLEWLAGEALNTNYNVLVVIHITPLSNMYNADRLADIINAFCDKTSGSNTVYGGEVVSWDFTNSTAGKVIAALGGHTHSDSVTAPQTGSNPFKCPLVVIRNTFYDVEHSDIANSEKSYAYDVAILNLSLSKLFLYRRGNGENRTVDLNM